MNERQAAQEQRRLMARAITSLFAQKDAEIARLTNALEAEARIASVRDESVEGWQDISTAPRDGTEIIGFRPDQGVFGFRWATEEEFVPRDRDGDPTEDYDESFACWWNDRWGWLEKEETPSHWRPLPAPPAPKQEGA